MEPSKYYQKLIDEIGDSDEQAVFGALCSEIGKPMRREELTLAVYGVDPRHGPRAFQAADRKVRKCIERLRVKGYPIASTSGKAGYAVVVDPDRIDAYIAEESLRIIHIKEKIDALYRAKNLSRALREWKESRDMPLQAAMF